MIPNDKLADPFRIPKAVFFDLICMGLICFSLNTGLRKRYFNKYLAWFSSWVFFTIFLGFYLPFSLSFNNRQMINLTILEPMIHFILGLWASYVVLSYFDKDDYLKIARFVCISSILISSVGILQKAGLDIFGEIARYNHGNRICAFLDNPNLVGNYLCLTLPFFFLKENRKFIFGLMLAIIAIILTLSELSIACAIVGLIVYLLLINRRKVIQIAVSVFILFSGAAIFLNQKLVIGFASDRLNIWKAGWVRFKDNPIFGQGLGIVKSWGAMPNPVNNTRTLNLHNDWFEITVMLGIVGLVLLIIVIVNSIRKFNYRQDNVVGFVYLASFAAFLFLMAGSFPIEIAPLALFGLLNWWAVETL